MSSLKAPMPIPKFFEEAQQLSTKKARNTPRDQGPPRPPVKSAPTVSRIYFQSRLPQQKAQAISFRNLENSTSLSKHYDDKRDELYFQQCFNVIYLLGVGSFGEVFKVQSKEDGKFYAVKRSRDRFKGEFDRAQKLEEVNKHEQLPKHPNCVEFIKAWEEKQHLYIQTELCKTSLNHLAEENHEIPERLIWKYMVDLLLAVKHLHDHELLHLDIKPENIFISENGICKLGDFGLVVDLSKERRFEAQEGDPKYLALELMQGKFTTAADIFSLGITMLELACDLDLPRGGDAWHELRRGHIPINFTRHLSPELKEVIALMMTPNYLERPMANTILQHSVVYKVLRWRRYELFLKSAISGIYNFSRMCIAAFTFLWFILCWPWTKLSLFKKNEILNSSTPKRNHMNLEYSFSDDESLGGMEKNSLGVVPFHLGDSSTSGESHNGSFAASSGTEHIVNSTPCALRRRSIHMNDSPSKGYLERFMSSPQDLLNSPPFTIEDEPSKISLGPKNLLEVFDSLSDNDDF